MCRGGEIDPGKGPERWICAHDGVEMDLGGGSKMDLDGKFQTHEQRLTNNHG